MRRASLIALLALAACDRLGREPSRPEPESAGRWTIIYSPHIQRSAMLLDTATGRTWNLVTVRDGDEEGRYAWEPVEKSNAQFPLASESADKNSN